MKSLMWSSFPLSPHVKGGFFGEMTDWQRGLAGQPLRMRAFITG